VTAVEIPLLPLAIVLLAVLAVGIWIAIDRRK